MAAKLEFGSDPEFPKARTLQYSKERGAGLSAVFGMGTGVTLPLWPPNSTYKWDMEKSCIVVLHTGLSVQYTAHIHDFICLSFSTGYPSFPEKLLSGCT
jgi:hypothetical protein